MLRLSFQSPVSVTTCGYLAGVAELVRFELLALEEAFLRYQGRLMVRYLLHRFRSAMPRGGKVALRRQHNLSVYGWTGTFRPIFRDWS